MSLKQRYYEQDYKQILEYFEVYMNNQKIVMKAHVKRNM